MKLGIDVDGVLADFIGGFKKLAAPIGYKIDESTWGLGLTKAQERELWCRVDEGGFWGNLEVLNQLPPVPPEDEVFFITKRRRSPGDELVSTITARWIRDKQGIECPIVLALDNKGEVCKAVGIDAFIDDKPENCWDVLDNSPKTKVFILNQPWNQEDTRAIRVNSMEEFFERVNG